jgi:hypothetical protein
VVWVSYTVAADAPGTLGNQASVFGEQPDSDPAKNVARSAITATALPVAPPEPSLPVQPIEAGPQPIANLVVVSKHVNHRTARVRQRLTYPIRISNAGPSAASDVRLIDASRPPLKVLSIHPSRAAARRDGRSAAAWEGWWRRSRPRWALLCM